MINNNGWYKAKFQIESDENIFEGYTKKGVFWNGWSCPYFTLNIVKEILDVFDDIDAIYDESLDTFIFTKPDDYDKDPEIYEGEDILIDGKIIHVYGIGAYHWIWDEVEEKEED